MEEALHLDTRVFALNSLLSSLPFVLLLLLLRSVRVNEGEKLFLSPSRSHSYAHFIPILISRQQLIATADADATTTHLPLIISAGALYHLQCALDI